MKALKAQIAAYLEDFETPIGIAINLTILGLILLSFIIFILETYAIPDFIELWLNRINLLILILFTIEYLIRFWCAESKLKFVFNFFSLVDLIAILPLFWGTNNIKFIRILRWFRILRLVRFIDFNISILGIKTQDGAVWARIFISLFSIIAVYSGLIYQVEHQINPTVFRNFFDALYFSVITMTTVGFGDLIPLSESGRLVTLLMILTGIIVIPWQIGELTKQLVKTTNQVSQVCAGCGLAIHDIDANFCKICGTALKKQL
jgi:voltage-gated potassium channel